jgi:hypothetical protein
VKSVSRERKKVRRGFLRGRRSQERWENDEEKKKEKRKKKKKSVLLVPCKYDLV